MEDQEQKLYICRFCKQGFLNGKKLGGHMRGHLALISASKRQRIEEKDQESINGGLGVELDDDIVKKSQQVSGVEEDSSIGYGLRENPKKSWRISNPNSNSNRVSDPNKDHCKICGKGFYSPRALASHMRSHPVKPTESIKKNMCGKCGKGFDSVKALYGHMRCHSTKRSRPLDESASSSSSEEGQNGKLDGGMPNPIRKKRSCTRYKPAKPSSLTTSASLTSFVSTEDNFDDQVEQGAVCLMMLAMGVRSLDGGSFVISNSDSVNSKTTQNDAALEDSIDGSMGICQFKNQVTESGSGQDEYKKSKSNSKSQHIGNRGKGKASEDPDHTCPICFKGFASGQALGGHKKAHYNRPDGPFDFGEVNDNEEIFMGQERFQVGPAFGIIRY